MSISVSIAYLNVQYEGENDQFVHTRIYVHTCIYQGYNWRSRLMDSFSSPSISINTKNIVKKGIV